MAVSFQCKFYHVGQACAPQADSFRSALAEGEFSDLTIRCRNKDHAVHKVIVCSQSKFFRAACVNNCIVRRSLYFSWHQIITEAD